MERKVLFKGLDLDVTDEGRRNMFSHSLHGDYDALRAQLYEEPGLAKSVWGYFTP